jgi:hypothetical protein
LAGVTSGGWSCAKPSSAASRASRSSTAPLAASVCPAGTRTAIWCDAPVLGNASVIRS